MRKLGAAYDPDTFRQLEQWQMYVLGAANMSSLIVTLTLPQRQVPVIDFEKWLGGYCFGSPVRGFGVTMVAGWETRGGPSDSWSCGRIVEWWFLVR
jgi:hypothetical protein